MAASTAIELAKKEASMRIAAASRTYKTNDMKKMVVRKATVFGIAATYGAMNRMNVPHDIAGFPWKLGIATIANVGEALTSGKTQAVCAGIADSTTAIYIERSISTGNVIAGTHGGGGRTEVVYVDKDGKEVAGPEEEEEVVYVDKDGNEVSGPEEDGGEI